MDVDVGGGSAGAGGGSVVPFKISKKPGDRICIQPANTTKSGLDSTTLLATSAS
jgi:hypothetical protein